MPTTPDPDNPDALRAAWDVARACVQVQATMDRTVREVYALRDRLAAHCACMHDGRGDLLTECDEHREIRMERDALRDQLRTMKGTRHG